MKNIIRVRVKNYLFVFVSVLLMASQSMYAVSNYNTKQILKQNCNPVNNLLPTVSGNTVTLTWDAPVRDKDLILLEDFESIVSGALPDNWIAIDENGDGYTWEGKFSDENLGNNSSKGYVESLSYGTTLLFPNDYLILPITEGAVKISYYIYSSGLFSAENYAVMASSTGNNVQDFSIVFEENLENQGGSWIFRDVDLPIGTKYIAFRHYNCAGQEYLRLDDVTVTGGGNINIDDIAYNVYQNGNEIATNITGTTFIKEDVALGTHSFCVEANYADTCISGQVCVDVVITESVNCNPVSNLSGIVNGNVVTLSWNAPSKDRDIILFEDFETSEDLTIPDGWINIDADGDEDIWIVISNLYWLNPLSGDKVVSSWSYSGVALHPDNYLVTPNVEGATNVKFNISVNGTYQSEHYAVMASSTGTDISDFTLLYEETVSLKSQYNGDRVSLDKNSKGSNDNVPWMERNVELPVGTKYVAFRHYNCTNMNYLLIDDVTITDGDVPQPNVVLYNVYQDGGLIAENIEETTYVCSGVTSGNHNYCVEANYGDTCISNKECIGVVVVDNNCAPVTNLTGEVNENEVTLTWDAPSKSRDIILFENFETVEELSIPDGWLNIDADGDQNTWHVISNVFWLVPLSGAKVVSSWSYSGGTLTPDNYLVTKNVEGAMNVIYNISVNPTYNAEHYSVMVSSTGTNTTDFTTVFEETVSLKSNLSSDRASIDGYSKGVLGNSDWMQRTVQLPEGTKYIAFRHYNCTDMNYLLIDDVTVNGESQQPTDQVVYNIYQNGTQIASGLTETSFVKSDLIAGDYNYCVEANYGDTCLSEQVCVDVTVEEIIECNPVTNLLGEADGNQVTLSWDAPRLINLFDGRRSNRGMVDLILVSVSESEEMLRSGEAKVVLEAHNVWGDGSGYQLLLDADHNEFGVTIPDSYSLTMDCNVPSTLYDVFEYKIPVDADPSCTPNNMVMDGIDSIVIPAGMYDYVIAAPQAEVKIWIAGSGMDPTKADDYIFEAGKRYHFLMQMVGTGDGVGLTITGDDINPDEIISYNIYQNDIQIASEISETSYVLSNVEPGNYNYCVEAVYENICVSEQECVDVVVLGIDDNSSIKIYPNPAKDIVRIEGVKVKTVQIYNSLGQLIGTTDSNEIDVSKNPSGIYLFNIITVFGKEYKEKIIINK